MRRIILAAVSAVLIAGTAFAADDSHGEAKMPQQKWSFQGPFGTFDRTAARHGLQVYMEVCATCHSLNLLAYRHLEGIGLTEDEVKAVAAGVEVEDGPNDAGDMFTRPGKAADHFRKPYPNPQAARAALNGALPPDLSLIVKARKDGSNYLYALMTGYKAEAPAGFTLLPGMNYNEYFPGHQIAMPPPLTEGRVSYSDGGGASPDQMARDVVTFLAWAAEPEMEERKKLGIRVLLFLLVLTGLMLVVKRQIWAKLH